MPLGNGLSLSSVLGKPVSTIMSRSLYWLGPSAMLDEAARLMTERRVRHVPIGGPEKADGIISIRDVAKIILEAGGDWASRSVERLISRPPVSIDPRWSIGGAASKMKIEKTGSLLVEEKERPVGIITEKDIVHALRGVRMEGRVYSLMTLKPATVEQDTNLADSLRLMVTGGFRHAPVVSEGRLIGILSIRNVVDMLTSGEAMFSTPVFKVMTHDPITIDSVAGVDEAVALIVAKDVGSLPVVDAGRLVGILTERDIVYKVAARDTG